jgi:hypothetical protein
MQLPHERRIARRLLDPLQQDLEGRPRIPLLQEAPQAPDGRQFGGRQEEFFAAGAGGGDVDGGEDSLG